MRIVTAGHRVERTCEVCSTLFTVQLSFKDARFCSRACYRQRPTRYPRTAVCLQCGATYRRLHGKAWQARMYCSNACRGIAMRRGGYVSQQGYRVLWVGKKQMLEHRAVMEQSIGRKLLRTETVHHRDGDRLNNAGTNLELWDSAQPPGQRVEDKIAWCREFLSRHGLAVVPIVTPSVETPGS